MVGADAQLPCARSALDDVCSVGQAERGELFANAEHVEVELRRGHARVARDIFLIDPAAARLGQTLRSVFDASSRECQQEVVMRARSEVERASIAGRTQL